MLGKPPVIEVLKSLGMLVMDDKGNLDNMATAIISGIQISLTGQELSSPDLIRNTMRMLVNELVQPTTTHLTKDKSFPPTVAKVLLTYSAELHQNNLIPLFICILGKSKTSKEDLKILKEKIEEIEKQKE